MLSKIRFNTDSYLQQVNIGNHYFSATEFSKIVNGGKIDDAINPLLTDLIKEYKPTSFAIEAPFFGKNVQSMLKLGRAQGVAIAAAMQAGLSVTEYSPKKVKQSVTGNGNADKLQVLKMLETILKFEADQKTYDASDALAVAVCHHYQDSNVLMGGGGKNDWKSFIAKNPERVKIKK